MKTLPKPLIPDCDKYLEDMHHISSEYMVNYNDNILKLTNSIGDILTSHTFGSISDMWGKAVHTFSPQPRASRISFKTTNPLTGSNVQIITNKSFCWQKYDGYFSGRRQTINTIGVRDLFTHLHNTQADHITNKDQQKGVKDLIFVRAAIDKAIINLMSPIEVNASVDTYKLTDVSKMDSFTGPSYYGAPEAIRASQKKYKVISNKPNKLNITNIITIPFNTIPSVWSLSGQPEFVIDFIKRYVKNLTRDNYKMGIFFLDDVSKIVELVVVDKYNNIIRGEHETLNQMLSSGIINYNKWSISNTNDTYIPALVDLYKKYIPTIKEKYEAYVSKMELAIKAIREIQIKHAHLALQGDF